MSIKVDENDPVGELEPSFPYRDVNIKRNVDMKEFYDLESEIGRGKFGTVYRCREKSTGLTLAAKFVGIARREDRRNVEREVNIMRMLQHPRVIQLYDAFEASNVMCVVQELIEGGELFDRVIGDDFILTEKSCTVFVRQICEGVSFIHSKNVLHLDLKPENILCLTQTGNRIKIIDFGLARQYDPTKKLQVLFGTPEFVAPEVVNFDAIGFGTDMWSIGVICYVLLSGLSPFMGETDVETMANVTIATYDFDDEAFDDISEDAKDFIRKLLTKNIEGRYTATECLSHPWLRRRPPLRVSPCLDVTKENLITTVERWSSRETSPTEVITLPPTPPPTPNSPTEQVTPVQSPVVKEPSPKRATPTKTTEEPVSKVDKEDPPKTIVETVPVVEKKDIPKIVPEDKPATSIVVNNNVKTKKEKEKPKSQDSTPKSTPNPVDLPSPSPIKPVKTETIPVESKVIKDKNPEETKVSTFTWAKKNPPIKTQVSYPEGKLPNQSKESKVTLDSKFPSKFSLKPTNSVSNFTSKIQQGGTEITISKKALNPSPQPKIAGIVLGQTHPRGSDTPLPKKEPPKPKIELAETKPKVITHKIIVEGQELTEIPQRSSPNVSRPSFVDNQHRLEHPLLRNLQSDRFERRCSDISCFLENQTDGMSIINEIKRLSTRLFDSDLDESNNNSNSLLRQIANCGVAPRRQKFRVTNLNRDVPLGALPPPTNTTYFIPPNPLDPDSYASQTHSAPQTPRSSPERIPDILTKDVILRLFDKMEERTESSMESVANYVRSSKTQKTVTSISSK